MEIYKEIFGFGWISSEVCNFSNVGSYNAWIKRLAKESYANKNDQL